jgi:Ankyrin repeats (3 copies)
MSDYRQMLNDIEVHSIEGIRGYFEGGGDPNEVHEGIPLFTTMVEMYMRSPRFGHCVSVFIDYGLVFDDAALLAVLSNDADRLEGLIRAEPGIVHKTYSRFNNSFTSLAGSTLLHYCAEYNHVAAAKVLIRYGADINARAGMDRHGFGGHTPIFHTVCQNLNNSEEMLHYLLELSADLVQTVKGVIWGKGYEWESFIPAVNPVSYAMMGLLPQMHRDPLTVARVISLLLMHAYGIDYTPPNIPNAYLRR